MITLKEKTNRKIDLKFTHSNREKGNISFFKKTQNANEVKTLFVFAFLFSFSSSDTKRLNRKIV